MELLLTMVMLAAAVAIVADPLRRHSPPRTSDATRTAAAKVAREAKYREILDAELDFHTGKLSEADYREVDRGLRREALELLRRLDTKDTEDTEKDRG